MSVSEKMTAIANEIRELNGVTEKLGLDAMAENIDDANNEVARQSDLLEQAIAELDGKVDPKLYDKGHADGYAEGYEKGLEFEPPTVYEKAVNFYDYDGTLIYSFTKEECLSLTELPKLPTQNGLVCQEWNWSLEGLQNYVSKYGRCSVGATYITDNGATRFYITLKTNAQLEFSIAFTQSFGTGVDIDWGDGSPVETIKQLGRSNIAHTYAEIGSYIVSLMPADGDVLGISWDTSNTNIIGQYTTTAYQYKRSVVRRVELGKNITSFGSYTLNSFPNLTNVTLPKAITHLGHYTIVTGASTVILPKKVTSIGTYAFYAAANIRNLIYSETPVLFPSAFAYGVTSLEKAYLPEGKTEIANQAFQGCSSLVDIIIPDGITTIGTSAFNSCRSLSVIEFPSSISTIGNTAFSNCNGMRVYDFTKHTTVPTLASADVFTNIHADCEIHVPANLYEDWISATNWSVYADKIKGV